VDRRIEVLKEKPVWVFHGGKDEQVPVGHSMRMVDMLRKAGSDVRYTVYPNGHHDVWTQAYADPHLYAWFLENPRN
jgi:dipeptidyl aminopeptidase/acylaminoacyl peptidase